MPPAARPIRRIAWLAAVAQTGGGEPGNVGGVPGAAMGGGAGLGAAMTAISRIGAAGSAGWAGVRSQPAGSSTGWTTRCGCPPSVTTRVSTATYAVNRHSTPERSDVSTMRRSSSVLAAPAR